MVFQQKGVMEYLFYTPPSKNEAITLRHLRSDFDSDFTNEVHLGANSQDFKENSLRCQRPELASKGQGDTTQAFEVSF